MANSTAVQILDGNSSLKTVSTIDALMAAAGSPSANYLSFQSSVNVPVTVSSGTVTVSSALTIASVSSGIPISSATPVYVSSQSGFFTAAGTPSTAVMTVQFSTNVNLGSTTSIVVVSCGTVTLSSNPTVIPSSAVSVTPSSALTIASISSGVPISSATPVFVSSQSGFFTAAGTPSTAVMTVQLSTAVTSVAVSSGSISLSSALTIASISSGVPISSATPVFVSSQSGFFSIAGTPNSSGGVMTVQFSTNTSISVGTVTLSSAVTLGATGAVSIINGANTAAVKAALTAPSSTDPALVVALSPNGINPNGSAPSSASAPVVIASDQAAIPVTASGTVAVSSLTGGTITSLTSGTVFVSSGLIVVGSISSGTVVIASGTITSVGSAAVTQLSTFQVNLAPRATGGLTTYTANVSSGAFTALVSSAPATAYRIEGFNVSSGFAWVRLYDTSSTPTAGTTALTLKKQLLIPASTGLGAGVISNSDYGFSCAFGIGYTVTAGWLSTTATVVESSAYVVNIDYK